LTLPPELARDCGLASPPPSRSPVTPSRRILSEDSVAHPMELPLETTPTSHPAARISTPTSHTPSHELEENVYSTHPPSSGAARPLLELDDQG
jgi:hypothetical protein